MSKMLTIKLRIDWRLSPRCFPKLPTKRQLYRIDASTETSGIVSPSIKILILISQFATPHPGRLEDAGTLPRVN